jgi:hypothetical protein
MPRGIACAGSATFTIGANTGAGKSLAALNLAVSARDFGGPFTAVVFVGSSTALGSLGGLVIARLLGR